MISIKNSNIFVIQVKHSWMSEGINWTSVKLKSYRPLFLIRKQKNKKQKKKFGHKP